MPFNAQNSERIAEQSRFLAARRGARLLPLIARAESGYAGQDHVSLQLRRFHSIAKAGTQSFARPARFANVHLFERAKAAYASEIAFADADGIAGQDGYRHAAQLDAAFTRAIVAAHKHHAGIGAIRKPARQSDGLFDCQP